MLRFGNRTFNPAPPYAITHLHGFTAADGVEDTPVPSRMAQHSMTFEEAVTSRTPASDVARGRAEPASSSVVAPPSVGGPFTREIKLWDPSMTPLQGTTTNQDTYKAWPVSAVPPSRAPAYVPSPHKCEATTTSAEAYQAWPLERPAPPSAQAAPSNPHRFDGTTTNAESYRAYKIEPAQPSRAPAYVPSPHKCEATTTSAEAYQAWPIERPAPAAPPQRATPSHRFEGESETKSAYKQMPLPPPMATPQAPMPRSLPFEGESEMKTAYRPPIIPTSAMPALGVQTQGGQFHCLIPAATVPPTRRSATFTTVTVHGACGPNLRARAPTSARADVPPRRVRRTCKRRWRSRRSRSTRTARRSSAASSWRGSRPTAWGCRRWWSPSI